MKKAKKLLSVVLCITVILCTVQICAFTAGAEIDEDYKYSISDGKATVTGYNGNGGDIVIPSTLGGYPVVKIGDYAFVDCKALTSVIISDGVTSIGDLAFVSCYGLTSVTIGNSVTSIDYGAFVSCYGLTSIEVDKDNQHYSSQDGVLFNKDKTILIIYPAGKSGNYRIPSSVTSIGDWAFASCYGLTSVTIPNSVISIGNHAFYDCYRLTSVTIPDSVTSIGAWAFEYCEDLTSVTIPNSVTSIGSDAFEICDNLTIKCYENSYAHQYAIDNNINFELIHEHNYTAVVTAPTCTEQGYTTYTCTCGDSYVDNYTEALGHNYVSGECTRCHQAEVIASGSCGASLNWEFDKNGTLTITGTGAMDNYSISAPWFSRNSYVKTINIGDEVTTIGNYAFTNCTALTSVKIGKAVTSIGNQAFYYCISLESITVPKTVTNIGSLAFGNCKKLTGINVDEDNEFYSSQDGVLFNKAKTNLIQYPAGKSGSYTIPNSVTSVNSYSFNNCSAFTSLTIPSSVTNISSEAFSNCTALTSIIVDEDNKYYSSQDGVLFNKDKTKLILYPAGKSGSYTIPDSVTSINSYAFDHCTGLTDITIPSSVKTIGSYAFEYCSGLTNLIIPDSVTSIGSCAFKYCTALVSVTLPDGITGITNYMFDHCSCLANIDIPDSVTSIGNDAFYATSLTSVTLPNNVTSIGMYAFEHCADLTSIIIPKSVTSISQDAFNYCTSFTDVYYTGSETEWNSLKANVGSGNNILLNANIHYNYAPPHIHNYVAVVTAPTCTEQGYTTYTCSCGDSYVSDYVFAKGHIYDDEYDPDCNVCGKIREVPQRPQLIVESKKTLAGKTVTIDISTLNNVGFCVLNAAIIYDKTNLTLVNSENLIDGFNMTYNTSVVFDGIPDYTDDAPILRLTFEVNENAESKDYKIKLNFFDAVNYNKEPVNFETVAGTLTVIDMVYGDVNGDGDVTMVDLTLMRKCLSMRDPETGAITMEVSDGADVNGDGNINTSDLLELRKYFASRDPETGVPSYVLGPTTIS